MGDRFLTFKLNWYQVFSFARRSLFYGFFMLYLIDILNLSNTHASLAFTIPLIVNTVLQITVWGHLSDKWKQHRKIFVIIGEIIFSASTIISFLLHKIPSNNWIAGNILIIGLSIGEIFGGMLNVGWSALISDLYVQEKRAHVMSTLTGMGSVGDIIGSFLGSMLFSGPFTEFYEGWGYSSGTVFFGGAIFMIISIIPLFTIKINKNRILLEEKDQNIYIEDKENEIIPQLNKSEENITIVQESSIKYIDIYQKQTLNKNKSFQNENGNLSFFFIFIAILLAIHFGRNAFMPFFQKFFSLSEKFDIEMTDFFLGLFDIIGSFGMLIFGIFSKKFNQKIPQKYILLASSILFSVILLTFAQTHFIAIAYLAVFFAGLAEVYLTSSSYSYAAALIPENRRGRLFAIYNSTLLLSFGLPASIISGPIIDLLLQKGNPPIYSYETALIISSGIIFLGVLGFILLEFYRNKISKKDTNYPIGEST